MHDLIALSGVILLDCVLERPYLLDMTHVSALAQHIFTLEPDKDAARLSLYQYLTHLCDPTELVSAELINRFYARALNFTHWQTNKAALFRETESILVHFQNATGEALALGNLLRARDLQVISAENLRDVELTVQKHFEKSLASDERVRVLREGDSRILSIVLGRDRSIKVTSYSRALSLMNGQLAPLSSDLCLLYTPDLQLAHSTVQQIEVGPFTTARFHAGSQGLIGTFVRGYTFQKFGVMDGGGLNRYPLLFYPMKRIEQFFIDRQSDPMYIDLVTTVERTLEILADGNVNPEMERVARATLERGRLALDHIFPEDSFFRLLINKLEKSISYTTPGPRSIEPELLKDEPWPEIKNLPV